jgi:PKD repeat protein
LEIFGTYKRAKSLKSKESYFYSLNLSMKSLARLNGYFRSRFVLAAIGLLGLITTADALPFTYQPADLCLGFRKTGAYQGSYECVVDVGPFTNYLNLSAGTTVKISQYTASQIDPDSYPNFTNLSWSVCGYAPTTGNPPGYPISTLWITVPRLSFGVPAPGAVREKASLQHPAVSEILSILQGAVNISASLSSNQDNTATFVQEPYSIADGQNYGAFMGDPDYPTIGDLHATAPLNANGSLINLENTTVAPFATALQSDLYEVRPTGNLDPHTGLTNGVGYAVGYFQLDPNGTMTFTRASATVAAPIAGFSGTPTNGVGPLQVVFTDASTGSVTNWLWTFGDGFSATNTSNASVTHTYTNAATYSVSLTVTGPGGANTLTQNGYIVVSPGGSTSKPVFSRVDFSGGQLTLSGTNGTANTQYRVLVCTNLTSGNWTPVFTNQFSSSGTFGYTNNSSTGTPAFFRLVSP